MHDEYRKSCQHKISAEHGKNFHKNINLTGYCAYVDDSFISYRITSIRDTKVAIIEYVYAVDHSALIKLLSFFTKFCVGQNAQFVYLKEHKRKANYVKEYFEALGFTVKEHLANKPWKAPWVSDNGFAENLIVEAYI